MRDWGRLSSTSDSSTVPEVVRSSCRRRATGGLAMIIGKRRDAARSKTQIRTTLKKKAFEDAGIPIPTRQVSSTVTSHKKPVPHVAPVTCAAPVPRLALVPRSAPVARVAPVALSAVHPPPLPPPTALGQNAEVTLNMLNASENEDVDGLGSDVKLEFESTNDEVAT